MKVGGMAGRIKKTEHVEIIRTEYGMSEVIKPGTEIKDYVMRDDLEVIEEQTMKNAYGRA